MICRFAVGLGCEHVRISRHRVRRSVGGVRGVHGVGLLGRYGLYGTCAGGTAITGNQSGDVLRSGRMCTHSLPLFPSVVISRETTFGVPVLLPVVAYEFTELSEMLVMLPTLED